MKILSKIFLLTQNSWLVFLDQRAIKFLQTQRENLQELATIADRKLHQRLVAPELWPLLQHHLILIPNYVKYNQGWKDNKRTSWAQV